MHWGVALKDLGTSDPGAVREGLSNLEAHLRHPLEEGVNIQQLSNLWDDAETRATELINQGLSPTGT